MNPQVQSPSLRAYKHRLTATFERGLRQQLVMLMMLFVTGFLAVVLATVLAVSLR